MKDLEVTDYIDYKASRRMDRFTHLALAAARQAEADAELDIAPEADRIGAAVATGIGGLKSFEACIQVLDERGPDRVNPFSIVQIIPNLAAGWVSMELGTKGPLLSECTACAASNMAIGDGLDAIRLGRADVMICGGTEAPVSRVGIAGFGAMRAISRRNDDPKAASRPFDLERDGFVMGEAAAMVVLEELEHAKARGAKIYAELLGYGVSSDATHVSDPDPTGASPARALQMAFDDAGITPDEVGYVNAHGTSTPVGDSAETRVIKLALGEEKAYADPGLVDEGRDRALPRRGGRGRGVVHDPRARAGRPAADDQPGRPRPGVRPRLHPERVAGAAGRDRRLELVRLRRPQRLRRLPALARLTDTGHGSRRSRRIVSCQTPSRWAMRSRRPTTRKPTASWRRRLATLEAMIEVWIVQIPCAGASASSRTRRAAPMPRPRTPGSTYTECSTTPR